MTWAIIGWTATVLSIVGLVLNARKSIWCWPIWVAAASGWLLVFFHLEQWAAFTLWACYQGVNIWGWIQWTRTKPETTETVDLVLAENPSWTGNELIAIESPPGTQVQLGTLINRQDKKWVLRVQGVSKSEIRRGPR